MSTEANQAEVTNTEVTPPTEPVAAEAPQAEATAQATSAEAPAYTPSYKYKAFQKDYDVPEEYRGYIKTKEDEERITKALSALSGVDVYKNRFNEVDTKYRNLEKTVNTFNQYLNDGDLDTFFSALKIPEKMIYDYVHKKLSYEDLPPEQKRIYDEQQEFKRRSQTLGQQNQEYMSRMEKLETQIKQQELNSALSHPEVQSIQKTYDTNHGPNAFWNKVVSLGAFYEKVHGVDKSASELIQELTGELKPWLNQAQQSPQSLQPQVPQAPQKKPVIPKVGSGSGAPASRAIKSVEDLKRMQKEMYE